MILNSALTIIFSLCIIKSHNFESNRYTISTIRRYVIFNSHQSHFLVPLKCFHYKSFLFDCIIGSLILYFLKGTWSINRNLKSESFDELSALRKAQAYHWFELTDFCCCLSMSCFDIHFCSLLSHFKQLSSSLVRD